MSNALNNVTCEELDWFNPRDLGKFDLIIGSELVYLPELFRPLINTLDVLYKKGSKVFICNEFRMRSDLEFYRMAQSSGWTITILPLEYSHHDYISDEILVLRFDKLLT